MTTTRAWTAGAAAVAVLLLVASWFLLVSPQRSQASSLHEQVQQQEQVNQQTQVQTQQLKAQFASLPARQAELAEIKQQMPENPALPALVRDLSKFAGAAGVTLSSVAPATPTPLEAPGEAGGATTPVAGIQQIPTTVIADGTYAELTLYLQKLQSQMRRAVLVENIQLTKLAGDGAASGAKARPGVITMTMTAKVFVLDTAAVQAGAPATTTTPSTSNAN